MSENYYQLNMISLFSVSHNKGKVPKHIEVGGTLFQATFALLSPSTHKFAFRLADLGSSLMKFGTQTSDILEIKQKFTIFFYNPINDPYLLNPRVCVEFGYSLRSQTKRNHTVKKLKWKMVQNPAIAGFFIQIQLVFYLFT